MTQRETGFLHLTGVHLTGRAPHSVKGLGHEDNIDNNDQLWGVEEGDFAVHASVYGEV
jgi:hypothetical protein